MYQPHPGTCDLIAQSHLQGNRGWGGKSGQTSDSYVCPWLGCESSGAQPHRASSASLVSSWPLALGAGLHFLLPPQATSPSPGVICLLVCPWGSSAPFTPIPTPCSGGFLLEKRLEGQLLDQERPPPRGRKGNNNSIRAFTEGECPPPQCSGPR